MLDVKFAKKINVLSVYDKGQTSLVNKFILVPLTWNVRQSLADSSINSNWFLLKALTLWRHSALFLSSRCLAMTLSYKQYKITLLIMISINYYYYLYMCIQFRICETLVKQNCSQSFFSSSSFSSIFLNCTI